jgi:hypothetical protein
MCSCKTPGRKPFFPKKVKPKANDLLPSGHKHDCAILLVRVFEWQELLLPARAGSQGEFREVKWNEPMTGANTGKAKRKVTFTDGSTITVETMADLIVSE